MSAMNGVALCASCHIRYDDQSDPRLVFYPQDLDFFIFFELRDRACRSKDGSLWRVSTAAQYAKRGALYTRIVSRRKGQEKEVVKEPARWGGAPLGVLKRAFDIMGCARTDGIPEADMQRLRDLWDLYHRDNDETAQRMAARYGFSTTEEGKISVLEGSTRTTMSRACRRTARIGLWEIWTRQAQRARRPIWRRIAGITTGP